MIYLDYNATTPVDSRVADAMIPYIREQFGNPGSAHVPGKIAAEAIAKARFKFATLTNAHAGQIVFTGCATEANNIAVKGVAEALYEKGKHIVSTAVEHPSIMAPLRYLEKFGWEITILPVDSAGLPDPDDLKKVLRKDTILVTAMLANNETGTILPIADLAKIAKEHGVLFHTDASQAIGKIEVDAEKLGVDMLTVAGHKFYAPKGVGALFIRTSTIIAPVQHGGGQEQGMRSGTENVCHIVAIGEAARIATQEREDEAERIRKLRDRLHDLLAAKTEVRLLGRPIERLPNTLNIAFIDCKGERVLEGAPEVAASLGAACHDKLVTMSSVLSAMKVDPLVARGAVRISLGRFTTEVEVDNAAEMLADSAMVEKRRSERET